MQGLAVQDKVPDVMVIGVMQNEPYANLPPMPFPVRQVLVPGEPTPLSAARNACARNAGTDMLVFLDVDCIPSPGLVAAFAEAVEPNRCVFGDTRYLTEGDVKKDVMFERLWQQSIEHPARKFSVTLGSGVHQIADMGEFWSLSFAMTKQAFEISGGFDEQFRGYGGEDTDFAKSMEKAGVTLFWASEARSVHQWHPVHIPPVGHLDHIVRNANLFHRKHGRWCMDYWLGQLETAGYISWDERVTIVRRPSADELKAAIQDGTVPFS